MQPATFSFSQPMFVLIHLSPGSLQSLEYIGILEGQDNGGGGRCERPPHSTLGASLRREGGMVSHYTGIDVDQAGGGGLELPFTSFGVVSYFGMLTSVTLTVFPFDLHSHALP